MVDYFLKLSNVTLNSIWDNLAELKGFIDNLSQYLQGSDLLRLVAPSIFWVVDDVVLKAERLKQLTDLAKDLGPECKVELRIEDLIESMSVLWYHLEQLVLNFTLRLVS